MAKPQSKYGRMGRTFKRRSLMMQLSRGRVVEADPTDTSVGYGGLPDREGRVTPDACIMDDQGNCGSVAFVQGFMHPVSIARMVMGKLPHVMLVGAGAENLRSTMDLKRDLLTPQAEKTWKEWLKKSEYKPDHSIVKPNHDTIGILALDDQGKLSGACTTSGMAFKMHAVLAIHRSSVPACMWMVKLALYHATGVGEEMIRISGSHTIVELMRQGTLQGVKKQ